MRRPLRRSFCRLNVHQPPRHSWIELQKADFVAPDIFLWEILNLILRHARFYRLNVEPMVSALDLLKVESRPGLSRKEMLELMDLGPTENLSLFDAAYLARALDLDAPLATRDAGWLRTSALAGAPYLDLR